MSGLSEELFVTVTAKVTIADDVTAFTLTGEALPDWAPGAHVVLLFREGFSRSYSIFAGGTASYQIAVRREERGRGGSTYICDEVKVGDRLRLRPPRNNFPLASAGSYMFIAGGIGVTPILPMLRQAHAQDASSWSLIYGGRSRESMPFLPDLREFPGVEIWPEEEAGFLPLEERLGQLSPGGLVYVCGPSGLIDAVRQCATDLGIAQERVHYERFNAGDARDGVDTMKSEREVSDAGFEVVLTRSERTLHVPADRSVLDCLVEAGVPVFPDCEEGLCGSCETRVLSGTLDHRDDWLSEEERERGDVMMPCVSRCTGQRLVLDA